MLDEHLLREKTVWGLWGRWDLLGLWEPEEAGFMVGDSCLMVDIKHIDV